jgi:hypothetical protein
MSQPFVTQDAPLVFASLKVYHIIQDECALRVVDKFHALLQTIAGLSYSYSDFRFTISANNGSCEIYIYRNTGEHKKPKITGTFTSEMIPDDGTPQYAIVFQDTTRYFDNLFGHTMRHYSAVGVEGKKIPPFSLHDLNYGLYLHN